MSDSDKSLAKSGKGLDIRDIIVKGLKVPGVLIERSQFLRTELSRYPKEVIEKAVSASPAQAGISPAEIDGIADEIIQAENWKVSGASFVLGFPGGWSMAATIPADLIQYYAWTLRIIQKLLYLYGFPEIDFDEDGEARLDSATVNKIVLCFGVMYGVHGANQGIKVLADGLAKGVEKKLVRMALTKTTFYPLVKEIVDWFGVTLTKKVFAGFFRKAIPVLGGVISGSLTYFMFKKCCENLKDTLKDTKLSNLNHNGTGEEDFIVVSCQ